MRKAGIAFLFLVGMMLLAAAGPGLGITTDSTLSGTGSTSAPLKVNTTNVQSRVASTCAAGTAIRAIGDDGTVTCQTASGTTYTSGDGVTVLAGVISIDPTYAQRRVSSTCTAGSSIRAIAQDGTVTCETDDSGGITNSAPLNTIMMSNGTNAVASSITESSGYPVFSNGPSGINAYAGTHLEWAEEFMFGTQPGGNIVGTPPYGTFLSINQAGANAGPNVHDASIAAGTRPGLVDCYTGTSSTGRCGFATGVDLLDFGAVSSTVGEFVFGEKNVSTSTERYATLIGFFDTMSSVNPTDGCYFSIDEGAVATNPTTGDTTMPASNAVKIWCASNGTRSGYVLDGTASEDSFTTVAVTAGDLTLPNTNMMHLKVVMEGATKAHFWAVISGSWTEVGRITTNIPTGSTRVTAFGINTIKSVGTTIRITTIDYARLAIDLSSVRSP